MITRQKFTVADKISKLQRFLKSLKSLQRTVNQKKFFSEEMMQRVIERYLQLSIEAVLDIADQIINEEKLRKPEEYRDTILILGENGILPSKFAKHFSTAAGFRNILVHDYVKLDEKKVYLHFKKDVKDIEAFVRHVLKYLKLS